MLQLRRARQYSPEDRRALQAAGRRLWPLYRPGRPLARYFSMGGEPDPAAVLAGLQSRVCTKPIVCPELSRWPADAGHMGFVRAPTDRPQSWRRNNRGFVEPRAGRPVATWSLDLVLVPLLAFDQHGRRLGRGGGHYDRALARGFRRPLLVGLAWPEQQVDEVPALDHDIPLDAVLTPGRLLLISARARRRCCAAGSSARRGGRRDFRFLPGSGS